MSILGTRVIRTEDPRLLTAGAAPAGAVAVAVAAEGTSPPADNNAGPRYRRHLAPVLTRRAREQAAVSGAERLPLLRRCLLRSGWRACRGPGRTSRSLAAFSVNTAENAASLGVASLGAAGPGRPARLRRLPVWPTTWSWPGGSGGSSAPTRI